MNKAITPKEHNRIQFTVPGKPQPQQRPRVKKNGNTYTPNATTISKAAVAALAYKAMEGRNRPFQGAIKVTCLFIFKWPKKTSKKAKAKQGAHWHTVRPDVDNLQKLILDGLNGVVFKDDSQVAQCYCEKTRGDTPCAIVTVEPLCGDEMVVMK